MSNDEVELEHGWIEAPGLGREARMDRQIKRWMDGWMDGKTDKRMDGQILPVFYKTSAFWGCYPKRLNKHFGHNYKG